MVIDHGIRIHSHRWVRRRGRRQGPLHLYAVLGVPTRAPVREIKSTYRRKARDTHPGKNAGVLAEEAAAAFREVVRAF